MGTQNSSQEFIGAQIGTENKGVLNTAYYSYDGVVELALQSRQPIALQFRRWIIEDAPASIMTSGSYTLPQAIATIPPTLAITNGATIQYMNPETLAISPISQRMPERDVKFRDRLTL